MPWSGFNFKAMEVFPCAAFIDAQQLAPQPVEPVSWRVREFVLVQSLQGKGVHRQLGKWPLQE